MASNWRRFEVLLPLRFNDGREVPPEWLAAAVLEVGARVAAARYAPHRADGPTCEVKRMYLAPTHRGRGFAGRVLAELERLAAGMGYTTVRLETGVRQPDAARVYERAGYAHIPPFGPYVDDPRSIGFEKRL